MLCYTLFPLPPKGQMSVNAALNIEKDNTDFKNKVAHNNVFNI